MERFFEGLRPFIRRVVAQPWAVLVLGLVLALGGLYFAAQLRVDTDLAKLLPDDHPTVVALQRLKETVGGESAATVGILSPSFEASKRAAEALIPQVLALRGEDYDESYFSRVDYYQDVSFLENNALYFSTDAELTRLEDYLEAQIDKARCEANPFCFDISEDLEEEGEEDTTGEELQASYEEIVSKEYPISDDSTIMALNFYPTGSTSNIQFIDDLYADLRALAASFDAAAFHPEMEIRVAGRLERRSIEIRAITNDIAQSLGAGIAAVLLIVVLYFFYKAYQARAGRTFNGRVFLTELARMPVMALVIGLPLVMSLLWTFGIASVTFGTLNLMTSTLGLVLFGLGIDFGIHFYARYAEERARGHSIPEATEYTFVSTGQAIATGALTTSAALFVLFIAKFRGFSEFGLIAGIGILFALVAMTVVMPAFLVLCERLGLLDLEAGEAGTQLFDRTYRKFPGSRPIVIVSLVAVVAALVMIPKVSFEYEFGKLEPTYTEYNERNEFVREVFGSGRSRRNPAYIVVDREDQIPAVTAAIRARAAADTTSPTVNRVESLQDRFPNTPTAQQARLARIAAIRDQLNEPAILAEASDDLARLRQAAQTDAPIALDDVPEHLRERFTAKDGTIGNFVIIYPSVGLSDGRNSIAFAEDIGRVETEDGEVFYAASTSLAAANMLLLIQEEAGWMVMLTLLIVVVVMWFNFRSKRWTLLALIPLLVGILWMVLILELTGLKMNFYNLIVLPAVLGIGNDAGVHIVHRYREEGRGSLMWVLRSTGEHITMGSLTTMIGFAGPLLSFHPGLQSIGLLAVIGIGATLISAIFFLPALLQWLEDRQILAAATPPAEPQPAEAA